MVFGQERNQFVQKIVKQLFFLSFLDAIFIILSFLLSFSFISIVFCLTPPVIEHARHSALPEQGTFELDSTVQYHCYTGYVTAGFPRAKCLAIDGAASW